MCNIQFKNKNEFKGAMTNANADTTNSDDNEEFYFG
jgi:hypothetical protein